jgi:hypothetical protein
MFNYKISRNGERKIFSKKCLEESMSLQVVKFWDRQILPVNDAVDGTEKDGSSFVMKDDNHGRLNKDREKKHTKLVVILWLSVEQQEARGWIHEHKISLRLLGIIMRVPDLRGGFCMDFLSYREGVMVGFYQVFLLSPLQCTVTER